jgi:hypothetical protein
MDEFLNGIPEAKEGNYMGALNRMSQHFNVDPPEYVVEPPIGPIRAPQFVIGSVKWLSGRTKQINNQKIEICRTKREFEQRLAKLFWDDLVSHGVAYMIFQRLFSFRPPDEPSRISTETRGPVDYSRRTLCLIDYDNIHVLPSGPTIDVVVFCAATRDTKNLNGFMVHKARKNLPEYTDHMMSWFCGMHLQLLKRWQKIVIYSKDTYAEVLVDMLMDAGIKDVQIGHH